MMNYPVHRTPEQGHTARCMAKAMIVAIENLRDSILDHIHDQESARIEFRLALQENAPLQWADGYLEFGDTECICPKE